MKICREWKGFPDAAKACVFAIGAFDGLHRGHQELIDHAKNLARKKGISCWIMTFSPHPAKFLRPELAPLLIDTPDQQLQRFGQCGVDGAFFAPFNADLASLSPTAFVEYLFSFAPHLQHIVTGKDWRFGERAAGDLIQLARLLEPKGAEAFGFEPISDEQGVLSSTRIRNAVQQGDFDAATAMLGRPFSIQGEVVHGKKLGRELGAPTANVAIQNELLPAAGVYAVQCGTLTGAGYRSDRPGHEHIIEVHFFDFDGDLYGKTLEIELLQHIRDDQPFEDLEKLKSQIHADIEAVRASFK